jgi:hypothetical protein
MFDNPFANQHRFEYFEPSENEGDVVNDDEIIPHVPEFGDVSRSVLLHNWAFSHKRMSGMFDLEVGQTSNSKNELVNADKWWHITHSVEHRLQWSNLIFVQLQYMQAPKYKCYFCREYHKRSYSFEIES